MGNGCAIIADVRCETCKYYVKVLKTPKCIVKKEYGEFLPTCHWCAEFAPNNRTTNSGYNQSTILNRISNMQL